MKLWNTVYDFRNKRVITPVSRDWCSKRGEGFGDYVLFEWDTFFAGLQFALIEKDMAYAATFSILEEITPEGMIPNFGSGVGTSRDRSEPQVGSLVFWKLYQQFGDRWFVEECFDKLLSWNRWRFRERDFNNDGLMELASTPWDSGLSQELWTVDNTEVLKIDNTEENIYNQPKYRTQLESGLDNSPMWDNASYNEENGCMELSYVGLNALMAADCELLEKMAVLLGRKEESQELQSRRLELSKLINEKLWDESRGFYLNRHWSGEYDPCISLTGFFPLLAGIVDKKKENQIIDNYLLNEEEFWGKYVVPNVSRSEPSFVEQEYWRGRIWAPTNFLLSEGIMRIKRYDVMDKLVANGLDLFVNCWEKRGVVGENYSAITGDAGEEDAWSDRFYHWGALLVYMAVERIINFNQWDDKIEFRHTQPDWFINLKNLPVRDKVISIENNTIIIDGAEKFKIDDEKINHTSF